MYGIPKNLDLSELIDQSLDLISFSINTVNFIFGNEISITVESSYSYQTIEDSINLKERIPIKSSNIMNLIGKCIKSIDQKNPKELILEFSNSSFLTIYDDSEMYESFQIKLKDKNIVI